MMMMMMMMMMMLIMITTMIIVTIVSHDFDSGTPHLVAGGGLVCDVCDFQGTKRLQAGARGCHLMCSPKMRKIQYARADIAMNMICDGGAVMITIMMMIASILT